MNFLKITYRNFIKHKSYSLINILGLSIGLACAILILAYSDIKTVYVFAAIALVILLIACINFMNLTTARSENPIKSLRYE